MAVTGQQVFDNALVLMDEVTETGAISTDTPNYYKTKALTILTTLQAELLPLSQTPPVITDLTQPLLVSDRDALSILPYGLAAHLLLAEDLNAASFFNNRYDELKRKRKTTSIPITDNYNILTELG